MKVSPPQWPPKMKTPEPALSTGERSLKIGPQNLLSNIKWLPFWDTV